MQSGFLSNQSKVSKGLILIGLILTGGGMSYFIGFLLIQLTFGLDVFSNPIILTDLQRENVVPSLKILQFMNSIGAFILPPVIFAFLVSDNWKVYLSLKKWPSLLVGVAVIVIMIFSQPWINLFVAINESLTLPDFLAGIEEWMMDKEESAAQITESFLAMNNLSDLVLNILLIGLIAALGEELFFRGLIQQYISKRTGNAHIGIWIAAILFSAIHMQFYGFIPRMLLGAVFGYMLYWTGSLYVPILAHFTNNAGAVALIYFYGDSQSADRIENVGLEDGDWMYLLASGLLIFYALLFIRRSAKIKA